MAEQVETLPPFQRKTGWDAYRGLNVCWQALFHGIDEDPSESSSKRKRTAEKWVVNLKHYDPSIPYSFSMILCLDINLEKYPEFKSMHRNELLVIKGTVVDAAYGWVLISGAEFEFTRTLIGVKTRPEA
jgi:hypothetical protein